MDERDDERHHASDNEDDDSYANAYLDDDDDDERNEDDDLAAMFAKVQIIQQAEGLSAAPTAVALTTPTTTQDTRDRPPTLDVHMIQATSRGSSLSARAGLESHSRNSTPTSARRSKSPASVPSSSSPLAAGITRSEDGIKTISRRTFGSTATAVRSIDALLHVKKPAIYSDKLLQTVKSTDLLEKLKTRAVIAAPATIAKRIEDLSAPAKKATRRKFATDDEEQHCRFKPKRSGAQRAADRDRDDDSDKRNDFIARMEAAEKSKQKRLEMTRGENEYNARLDKRCCPKCLTPQSYSEYKDKKKRCQMCGVEFRVLQAWGDVGHGFIARMNDATHAKARKHDEIRAHVVALETSAKRVGKTAKQQFYETQLRQKTSDRTFLERNYPSTARNSKPTQFDVQREIQRTHAKCTAAGYDSPII